jgi:sugar O-acyltransferase (sialic acid O-acetyltransferase NeuD family)
MKKKIILIGGGGHAKSCIDVIEQENKFEIAGILDIEAKIGQKILGYEIIGTDIDIENLCKEKYCFLITLGQIGSADKRIEIHSKLLKYEAKIATIISPLAYVSRHSKIEQGTIIMHGVIVNAGVCIGENCIINTKALIEHDSQINSHCHISTGVIINGDVTVREGSFVASGAVAKQGIIIEKNSFVKANTVIK